MNREIKFRGKRIDNGEWVYGCLVVNPYETAICDESDVTFSRVEVDPDTVGQITGLKDKNGVEIWEGDIVESPESYRGAPKIFAIKYQRLDNCGDCTNDDGIGFNLYLNEPEELTVIGNIYENPELVK